MLYFSDLDPLQAPLWSVKIQMTEDPQCLLGKKVKKVFIRILKVTRAAIMNIFRKKKIFLIICIQRNNYAFTINLFSLAENVMEK